MTVTEDMIMDCILEPVRSRKHEWRPGYKDHAAYDVLHYQGRSLYDNLRTKYDVPHGEAWQAAFERFGLCKTVTL